MELEQALFLLMAFPIFCLSFLMGIMFLVDLANGE
jgi:hypothetical protein